MLRWISCMALVVPLAVGEFRKIRCAAKYQRQTALLQGFVALWAGILEITSKRGC